MVRFVDKTAYRLPEDYVAKLDIHAKNNSLLHLEKITKFFKEQEILYKNCLSI